MAINQLSLLGMMTTVCVCAPLVTEAQPIPPSPETEESPIFLYLEAMASVPTGAIALGGIYSRSDGPEATLLLVSTDFGRTWLEVDLPATDAGITHIEAIGINGFVALATFQYEGADDPAYIIRSVNAGLSWEMQELELPCMRGIGSVREFQFYDLEHGLIALDNSLGETHLYMTSDGGDSWSVLLETSLPFDVDGPYRYPSETLPLHASIWEERDGLYKATGILRIVESADQAFAPYLVERFETNWEAVTQIPRRGRLDRVVEN